MTHPAPDAAEPEQEVQDAIEDEEEEDEEDDDNDFRYSPGCCEKRDYEARTTTANLSRAACTFVFI